MKIILEPEDGVTPLIKAIDSARESIEIAIFRFDRADIQHALEKAAARGVPVRALIAHNNRGAESELRKLEMAFLAAGIEVGRTADDLLRYHYKFMIVDRRVLYMLTFNYTYIDITNTRSVGIITHDPDVVREATRLFEADIRRQPYTSELKTFLVSPVNARQELSRFIQEAEKQLLIYDPEISDPQMIRLLRERARVGVEIRVIGRVSKPWSQIHPNSIMRMRFHTRTIIRDGHGAFVGSQSLREAELDKRRELGLIIHERKIVRSLIKVFESDWASLVAPKQGSEKERVLADGAVKRVAKAVVRDLPLEPLVERALKQALANMGEFRPQCRELEQTVEDAVREALEDTVSHAVSGTKEANSRP